MSVIVTTSRVKNLYLPKPKSAFNINLHIIYDNYIHKLGPKNLGPKLWSSVPENLKSLKINKFEYCYKKLLLSQYTD